MERKELVAMLEDIDGIGKYVNSQMAIMPTEKSRKTAAAEMVQGVKSGILRMIEAHDQSVGALKHKIEARRAS